MKIEQSQVAMQGSRSYVEERKVQESMRFWMGTPRPSNNNRGIPQDAVQVSAEARNRLLSEKGSAVNKAQDFMNSLDPASRLLASVIFAITGRPVVVADLRNLGQPGQNGSLTQPPPEGGTAPEQPPAEGAGPQLEWSFNYDRQESYFEAEDTHFNAAGIVRTTDGKEIKFNVDLAMSRQYSEQSNVSLQAGSPPRRKDPLVINFDGNAAQLTSQKFDFDIDSDGQQDQISFVGTGSGFLVMDKNGDGVATDGSELFGAATGNGFGELARYDQDSNGWIDENDSIFMQLRVWTKDETGADRYRSLKDTDVGAIFLGNVATGFALKDTQNQNQDNGQIRSTGVFLKESGGAGTVQQIDLTV